MKTPPNKRVLWWALRRSNDALPVVFATKQDALNNADPDEAVYRVLVVNFGLVRRAAQDRRRRQR